MNIIFGTTFHLSSRVRSQALVSHMVAGRLTPTACKTFPQVPWH
jgi:hypothetical protein